MYSLARGIDATTLVVLLSGKIHRQTYNRQCVFLCVCGSPVVFIIEFMGFRYVFDLQIFSKSYFNEIKLKKPLKFIRLAEQNCINTD